MQMLRQVLIVFCYFQLTIIIRNKLLKIFYNTIIEVRLTVCNEKIEITKRTPKKNLKKDLLHSHLITLQLQAWSIINYIFDDSRNMEIPID